MDSYPTLDQLLAGMQSKLGTTDRWDVVASYSLDKLNALLKKAWLADDTFSTTFALKTESQNEDDETYYTDWTLKLGAPSLQFTLDNRASLLMALSGSWQNEGTDGNGKPHPIKSMPDDKYCLQVLVPLAIVSADRTSGTINQQVP
jgi:hypothetical protein